MCVIEYVFVYMCAWFVQKYVYMYSVWYIYGVSIICIVHIYTIDNIYYGFLVYIYCNDCKGIKASSLWSFSKSLELYLVPEFIR